jgi:FkbM family methyltransferase
MAIANRMRKSRGANFLRGYWHLIRHALRPTSGYQLLDLIEKYKIEKPKRILHVGANTGAEANYYSSNGIEAWHVEAIPKVYQVLRETCRALCGQYAIQACLADMAEEQVIFNISSNAGLSSSLLPLGRHHKAYPSIHYTDRISITTTTVDKLIAEGQIPSNIDFLVIDAQGAELLILHGAKGLLESGALSGAMIETAVEPLYENGANYIEVSILLRTFGLHLCQAEFNKSGWCDAIYAIKYWP